MLQHRRIQSATENPYYRSNCQTIHVNLKPKPSPQDLPVNFLEHHIAGSNFLTSLLSPIYFPVLSNLVGHRWISKLGFQKLGFKFGVSKTRFWKMGFQKSSHRQISKLRLHFTTFISAGNHLPPHASSLIL